MWYFVRLACENLSGKKSSTLEKQAKLSCNIERLFAWLIIYSTSSGWQTAEIRNAHVPAFSELFMAFFWILVSLLETCVAKVIWTDIHLLVQLDFKSLLWCRTSWPGRLQRPPRRHPGRNFLRFDWRVRSQAAARRMLPKDLERTVTIPPRENKYIFENIRTVWCKF